MRANDKMAKDVDIEELAKITKNFSGAELEGLVRAAQSWYVNPVLFKVNKSSVLDAKNHFFNEHKI